MEDRRKGLGLIPQPVEEQIDPPAPCPATWHAPRWESRPRKARGIVNHLDDPSYRTYPQIVKDAINHLLRLVRR